MAARARHVFHAITLVIGVIALVVLVRTLGWAGLSEVLARAGWWFVAIAAVDVIAVMFDSAGIRSFLRPASAVGFWRVFVAQASGVAVNRLTPGHTAGEPVKVTMLVAHAPTSAAVAAIVMFNLATIGIAIVAIALGVPLTALVMDLPGRTALVVGLITGALVVVALIAAVVVRRGALATLIDGAQRVRVVGSARAARWRSRVHEIDVQVQQFGQPGARAGIGYIVGSRLFQWLGTVGVMIAADVPLTAPLVLAMLSVGIVITWVSNVIPLGMGLADGSNYALFGVLGSTGAVGLAFTMINRARTVVLAGIGLSVMLVANLLERGPPDETPL